MSDRRTTRRTFRASQVPQALVCHGSAQLIRRIKENRSSQAAHLGNWCHHQAACTLIETHGAIPPDGGLVAPVMPANFNPSGFGKWMADYFVQTVVNEANADMAILVEQAFEHAFETFDLTGHIDAFAINADGTEAVGADLKTGTEIVDEAEQNGQVLAYMALLKCAYPELRKITFLIVQPQNDPDEGFERVTRATAEGDQLDGLVSYLERELRHAIEHENELNSDGWKQCRYCPVAATNQCPALALEYEDMKLTLTPEMIEAVKAEPSAEQLAALENLRKKFNPIFEAGHKAFKELIEVSGRITTGGYAYWLEESNGPTRVNDNAAAAAALADLPDDLYHGTYKFVKDSTERALATFESTRTGKKVPHKSEVQGKVSGQSLFKERIGPFTEQPKVLKLKSAEVAS